LQIQGGNLPFFKWLFTSYVVEFLNSSRKLADRDNEFCYLVIDGEAIQSKVFENSDVLEIFENQKIHVGKGPASCSGVIGNALDCGNLFKGIKSRLSKASEINLIQTELRDRIMMELEKHSKNTRGNLAADKKLKIANGITHLLGQQKETIKTQTIINSFKMIGMIPHESSSNLSPHFTPPTPFEMTLSRCPKQGELTSAEVKKIIENVGEMAKIFEKNGQITEEEMDNLGIVKGENNGQNARLPNDMRVQHQQRAILLTAKASVERRRQWIQQRAKEKDRKRKLKEEKKEKSLKRASEKAEEKVQREVKKATKRAEREEKTAKSKERREMKLKEREERSGEKRKREESIPPVDCRRRSSRHATLALSRVDGNSKGKRRKIAIRKGKKKNRERNGDKVGG
jgi:hypothetical protein